MIVYTACILRITITIQAHKLTMVTDTPAFAPPALLFPTLHRSPVQHVSHIAGIIVPRPTRAGCTRVSATQAQQAESTNEPTVPSIISVSDVPQKLSSFTLTEAERAFYARNFVDSAATKEANGGLSLTPFVTSEEELIEHCKGCYVRLFASMDGDVLTDDFRFVGPVVGPVGKAELIDALRRFDVNTAFPQGSAIIHGHYVDPTRPNRVVGLTGFDGVQEAPMLMGAENIGKRVVAPPQVWSMTFAEDGRICKITAGVVMDREEGNTGGVGGLFGLLVGIGKPLPFPEARPYKRSWQFRLFSLLS